MPRIAIEQGQVEYAWHGPSPDEAPTLIFLHEGLGSVSMWKDFPAKVAAETGLGALVYSRFGYGDSDPATLPRSVRFMHDEALIVLPQILDAFHIRSAILVGHSDGGSIALLFAASENSERLRGLVLEAPHVFVEDITVRSIASA